MLIMCCLFIQSLNGFLELDFTNLLNSIHHIRSYTIMNYLPKIIYHTIIWPILVSVKIKTDNQEMLGWFRFTFLFNGRPYVWCKKTDRVTTATPVEQVPGVIDAPGIRRMLEPDSVKTEQRNKIKSQPSVFKSQQMLFPPEQEYFNVFQFSIYPCNGGDMVGPADGIVIPPQ